MTLSAIICATHPCNDRPSMPRCSIDAGGMMLGERVMRQLVQAGISQIFILADKTSTIEIPPLPLTLPGATIRPVGRALDLAVQIEDGDEIILIEEGVLVDQRLIDAAVQRRERQILLCWSSEAQDRRSSRLIDAAHGFASVLKTTGSVVRTLVKGLGEWDFEQTLLRTVASQEDTIFLSAEAALTGQGRPLLWQPVHNGADAAVLRDVLIEEVLVTFGDNFLQRSVRPLLRKALEAIHQARLSGTFLRITGLLQALLAVLFLGFGYRWIGWALMVLTPVWSLLGDLAAGLRLEAPHPTVHPQALSYVLRLLGHGWWLMLGYSLSSAYGYVAMLTLAGIIILLLVVQRAILTHYHRSDVAPISWAASSYRLLWLIFPFACFGQWQTGLLASALVTAAGFCLIYYRFHAVLSAIFAERDESQS